MGRKPNTETRRAQIVEALLAEMAAVGYERASTRSIAARAGLLPGLLHYHFKSKQEILLVLVDELIAAAEKRFAAVLESAAAPAAKLSAFVSTRVGLGAGSNEQQVKVWVNILAEAMGQASVRKRIAGWLGSDHRRLAKLFAEAGGDQPQEQAAAMVAMILGSFSLHALQIGSVPRGYAERQILGWLAASLASA
jgi:TetR/AcrR family transcriptional repressor of bet genes